MHKVVITPELAEKILEMKDQKPSKIAKQLNLTVTTLRDHMVRRGLFKPSAMVAWRVQAKAKKRVAEGYFDVHERENWLI